MSAWLICPHPRPHAQHLLFCVPPAGAGASFYRPWGTALPEALEVWGIQLPGRETRIREPFATDLEAIAAILAKEIAAVVRQRQCPFSLFGHSFGALLAWATARQLHRQETQLPTHLFVSGRPAPQVLPRESLHQASDDRLLATLTEFGATPPALLADREFCALLLPIFRADLTLNETYTPAPEAPLAFPLTAFGGTEDARAFPEELAAWQQQTTNNFALQQFPGGHMYLRTDGKPLLQAIATVLKLPTWTSF